MKKYSVLLLCILLVGCATVINIGPRGTKKVTPLPQTPVGLPSLQGAVFVDSNPFDWPDLRGRVVLVAVLDFTKKDEQEILPVLSQWRNSASSAYGNFEIIAVHIPPDNIFYSLADLRQVMQEYSLEYKIKVIIDPEQRLWAGFGRFKKPFLVLVEAQGDVYRVYQSIVDYMQVVTDLEAMGIGVSATGFENNILAGFEKGKIGNSVEKHGFISHEYRDTGQHYIPGEIYLDGFWRDRPKSYYYEREEGKGNGYLAFRFFSPNVSIIAQNGKIRITLDEHDLPIRMPYIGEDVKVDAADNTFCEVTKKRIYNLIRNLPAAAEGQVMKIYPQETGFEIFEIRFSARHGWKMK